MRKLTETDARWIAKGYWDNHFNWKVHPKAKTAAVLAGIMLALVIVLAIASWDTDPTPSVLSAFTFLAFVAFMGSILWLVFAQLRERDTFLDIAQHRWETEKELPDRATVEDFINNRRN